MVSFADQAREVRRVEKVIATPAALALIEELKRKHGPVIFDHSGGCCDNGAANCYLPGELTIGAGDEYLGDIGGSPFCISKSQYGYWKHTQLFIDVIDVIDRHGGTFFLEGPEGKAFHARWLVFSAAERPNWPGKVNNASWRGVSGSAPAVRWHDRALDRRRGREWLILAGLRPLRRLRKGSPTRTNLEERRDETPTGI